jgi:NADPH-dependent 2,4-dienoyl-CoA reductase/sulfur reductase-like enzyme/rhodanese-related sulfurtransferase
MTARQAVGRRVVIVGGVAGGMSVATRLRRLDESAQITVLERSSHVSYANCGLPYFVGGVIEDEDDLLLQTPERLHERFRLDVHVDSEAVHVDVAAHEVTVRSTESGAVRTLPYDTLVLSTGASPLRPPIPGFERVLSLRNVEDAERCADEVARGVQRAVVIGGGFVGLEMAENLARRGVAVTVVEAACQVLTPLDPELAILVHRELVANGVAVEVDVAVDAVTADAVQLADGRRIPADLVFGAIGIRPDTALAREAGLVLGPHGGIAVDAVNRTSAPDVYAVGDAVEKDDRVSGDTSLIALANVANRHGRRVADHIAGRPVAPCPSLGTAIVKVFGVTAAVTGWNERRLRAAGRRYRAVHSHPMSHASYYPGASPIAMKVLFDPDDGTLLGAQAVGADGVDKRIDVLATAMFAGLPGERLADLELAYAPPFSSAKDPVNMLGYMIENVRSGDCDVVEPSELGDLVAEDWQLLDIRTRGEHEAGAIPGSRNIPLDELRERVDRLEDTPIVVYCEVGQRGHTATALLRSLGRRVRNLDGGYRTWLAAEAASLGNPDRLRPSAVDGGEVPQSGR